jgi:preprotein translocase subunit Sec63
MPTMSVEDACKLLGVTTGAAWESVEKARRQLVQQSFPERVAAMTPVKRDQEIDAARRVNAAYAVLSHLRTGVN